MAHIASMSLCVLGVGVSAIVISAGIFAPVDGKVVRHFERPLCRYCSGHRGVTISSTTASPVVAVADGEISFAGAVGGRLYVVQRIAPNVRVTYGGLGELVDGLDEGQMLGRGDMLATAHDTTYLGVRVGDEYVEPLRFLGLARARLYGSGRVVVGNTALLR